MVVKVIQKTKVPTKTHSMVEDFVERLAALKIELRQYEKLTKEFDSIKEALKKMIPDDAKPDAPYSFSGIDHDAEFSSMAEVRGIIDLRLLHDALGDDVFYAIAKVSLKDLDKYLSEAEQADFVVKERSGPRKLSIKEK
jgi:hypothetical protein